MLFLKMDQRNSTIIFKLRCTATNRRNRPTTFYNIAAAKFRFLPGNQVQIRAQVWYQMDRDEENENVIKKSNSDTLFVDKITIEDRKSNRWEYCGSNTNINSQGRTVLLQRGECNVL